MKDESLLDYASPGRGDAYMDSVASAAATVAAHRTLFCSYLQNYTTYQDDIAYMITTVMGNFGGGITIPITRECHG